MDESGNVKSWNPPTGHNVPQPAGHDCADWYERVQPPAVEILYALAHVKGECDRLRTALEEMVWAWDCDSVKGALQFAALHGFGPTDETQRIIAGVEAARATLARAPS